MSEEKIFVIGWGDTDSRYDPNYHRGIGYSLVGWEKLGRLAVVKGGKRIPLGDTYASEETGYYYLRVDNFSENGDLTGAAKWLSEGTYKALERYRIYSDDLLISIAGTIGRVAVFDERKTGGCTVLTENCAKIRPSDDVLPEYLMLLLLSDPLQKQMERDYIQTTIPKLGLDRIRGLRLPKVPSLEMQKYVVTEWHLELGRFTDSLRSAAALLDAIDEYLLSELGIMLPPEPEKTIANRIFTAKRKELTGRRFDPLFHSFGLWHAIEHANVPTKKLGLCCHYMKTGFAAGGDMQLSGTDGVVQLRPTNIDANRELVFGRNVYLDKSVLVDRPDDIVRFGEVIVNNTNSQDLVGKTAYMDVDGQSFVCSNHMTRIAVIDEELDAQYLTALLNAYQRLRVFFSLCTNWNNQSGVNVDLLRQLPIPLPRKEMQMQIAERIRSIRSEAKSLRQTAKNELDAAKRRIEAMLLGEVPL